MKKIIICLCFSIACLNAKAQNADEHSVQEIVIPDIVSADCECNDEISIVNSATLEGYLDKVSYKPGEIVLLYAHTLNHNLSVDFVKHGLTDTTIKTVKNICAKKQNYTSCSFKKGCNWDPNLYFQLDNQLTSGFYSLVLRSGNASYDIPFIISPVVSSSNKILVLSSTNTWQAYNKWGGASFYQFDNQNDCNIKYAQLLSTHRPNDLSAEKLNEGHKFNAEMILIKWLIENNYNFDVVSDDDLDNDSTILHRYKVFIISTHNEYWTQNMYNNTKNYLRTGGSLLSLGANQIYWKVVRKDDKMECKKDGSKSAFSLDDGGTFRSLGEPESKYLGVQYSSPGIATYSSYSVVNAGHWVFASTDLQANDTFGGISLTGKSGIGASGHETDKMTSFSPSNTVLLAKGQNPSKVGLTDYGAGGADMTIYEHPAGGAVFAVGSISYCGALSVDDKISRITKNVIDNFLNR